MECKYLTLDFIIRQLYSEVKLKEGLVRYLYHVRRDTWNDRLEPKGQAETLRQKEHIRTTLWRTIYMYCTEEVVWTI